jgi:protein O-mannosyl-transferase
MGKEKNAANIDSKKGNREGKKYPNQFWLDKIVKFPLPQVLIIVSALIIYLGTLSYGFINFDDDLLVSNNISTLSKLSNITEVFKTDAFLRAVGKDFYRPLQSFSFIIDLQISPRNPLAPFEKGGNLNIFHITNFVLHCLTCISLFYFFCLLKFDRRLSMMGALIFTVHPLFCLAVVWIPGRGDLLLGLFVLIGLSAFIKYYETRKYQYLALHLLMFLLSMFSKETAIALPIIVIIIFLIKRKEQNLKILNRDNSILITGWIIIFLLWFFMRNSAIPNPISSTGFGILPFIQNLATIPELMAKFILPLSLPPFPSFSIFYTILGLLIIALLALRIIIIFVYRPKFKNRHSERSEESSLDAPSGFFTSLRFVQNDSFKKTLNFEKQKQLNTILLGIIWFLVFLLPSLASRHPLGDEGFSYLNHRAYLPMMGILILIFSLIPANLLNKKMSFIGIFGFVIIIIFGIVSFSQSKIYSDPMTFYKAATEKNPNSALALNNLGKLIAEKGDLTRSFEYFDKAIALKSDYVDALSNRGAQKVKIKDYEGAISDLEAAIARQPDYAAAFNNLGIARFNLNDTLGALDCFDKAVKFGDNFTEALINRALLKIKIIDFIGAIVDYSDLIKISPKDPVYYIKRASAYNNIHEIDNACRDWQSAANLGNQQAMQFLRENCK